MRGSTWRKWDLHIHTPYTKLNNKFLPDNNSDIWTKYCNKIENSDVSVFGITDYFSCENYFTFISKFNKLHPNSNKIFFPNIEFRLPIATNIKDEEIHIHIIFSDQLKQTAINNFLTRLETNTTTTHTSRIPCKNLKDAEYESATVNHNDIIECLHTTFGEERSYVIVVSVNNNGNRPSTNSSKRKLQISDEIDKICDAFFGGKQNVDYCLCRDRYEKIGERSKPKPVISGCDAHSFDDIDNWLGKYIQNSDNDKYITWIKADPTFEGLKQILYEPKHRVKISEQKPREPNRKIESIKFNFPPDDTLIKRDNNNSKDKQKFCLNKLKNEVFFSPYFTCLIGGRGTGKSTIINLIGEKFGEETDFFKDNSLMINDAKYDIKKNISNYVEVKGTTEIEFVSQGEIEKFAEGDGLTTMIFNERIKGVEKEFSSLDREINSLISIIDETIKLYLDLPRKVSVLEDKRKEKDSAQNTVNAVNDERYKGITNKIQEIRKKCNLIDTSKTRYHDLLESIRLTLVSNVRSETQNDIEKRINEILKLIEEGIDEVVFKDNVFSIDFKEFEVTENRIKILKTELSKENQNLNEFFKNKGTSEEAIKDSQRANVNLARLNSEIPQLEAKVKRSEEIVDENSAKIKKLLMFYASYKQLITDNLTLINEKFKVGNENVLDIKFEFEFDREKFKEVLFGEFYEKFSHYYIRGTSRDLVKRALYLIEPDEDLLKYDYEAFGKYFEDKINSEKIPITTNYIQIIIKIFSLEYNFKVYQLIVRKHLYNLSKFIKIKGFYGDRELQNCSFGQRCTAVVVTLLMTGVKPLVIDEPEAHLDNRLVADYLVDLIKSQKLDRQIIFATHNANFVINGDSELIHILETQKNEIFTNITSTSIENMQNRDKLLKLEGGLEAFEKRGKKYQS